MCIALSRRSLRATACSRPYDPFGEFLHTASILCHRAMAVTTVLLWPETYRVRMAQILVLQIRELVYLFATFADQLWDGGQ
jgi:hypothetical protein